MKNKKFATNNYAVIGLPMRLTVSLLIGAAALSVILFYILNPCLFPDKLIVSIEPVINIIPDGFDEYDFLIKINVKDNQGYPVEQANIIIKGLGDARSKTTNSNGEAILEIRPSLDEGRHEGYLDLIVKASCFEIFSENNMIKIVRG